MKKLFFTLIAVLSISLVGFSQEITKVALTEGHSALLKSKVSGEYVYTLPSSTTKEHVEKVSKYYASYFTIDFDASTKVAKVKMNLESEKGEMIMGRFLSSCGVRNVTIDDKEIKLDTFMREYLK